MKMLREDIRLAIGINHLEAERALEAMLGFLGARLPSPVLGRIHGALFYFISSRGLGNAND